MKEGLIHISMQNSIAIVRSTYRWMSVCERVIDGHVLEEEHDMLFEESFDDAEVEAGIDEDGSEVGFQHVRNTLNQQQVSHQPVAKIRIRSHLPLGSLLSKANSLPPRGLRPRPPGFLLRKWSFGP